MDVPSRRRWVRGISVAGVVIGAWLAWPHEASAQKLVFVVRHAERADGGAAAGQMTAAPDPPLSAAGEARAQKLAGMLADAGVRAIYATEFRRTQDTGKPLATKLGLAIEARASRDAGALVQRLKDAHAGDVVLVIGHSNTVPAIIKAYGGPEISMGENEYDALFVIVPATGAVTKIRF
jgi:broad specificity phosphatase PhoE